MKNGGSRSQITRTPTLAPPPEAVRPAMRLLGLLLGLLPYIIAPTTALVDPLLDLKWPACAAGMLACLVLIFRENRQAASPLPSDSGTPVQFWREPFVAGAALIAAGLLLSALCSPVVGLGLETAVRELFFVLFALILAFRPTNHAEVRWILLCLLVSMGLQSLIVLGQFFDPLSMLAILPFGHTLQGARGFLVGTIGNPEYLASWLAVGLSAGLMLLLRHRDAGPGSQPLKKPVLILSAAASILILSAIFVCGGRGAALASAVALGVAGLAWLAGAWRVASAQVSPGPIAHASARKWPWIMAGLFLILLVLAGLWAIEKPQARRGTLPSRLAELTDFQSASMRQRLGLLILTSKIIADHPLVGVGPGRCGWAFGDMQARLAEKEKGIGFLEFNDLLHGTYTDEAHNDPLQWWAEYGLLPFLGLTLMVMRALLAAWPALRCGARRDALGAALWVAVATLALNMWVSFPLHRPVRALTFWALLGLLLSLSRTPAESAQSLSRPT